MSKKFKIGQIIGIITGVIIGSFTIHYVSYKIFGPRHPPNVVQGNYQIGQPQFQQNIGQQGVFEQALSGQSMNSQHKVY